MFPPLGMESKRAFFQFPNIGFNTEWAITDPCYLWQQAVFICTIGIHGPMRFTEFQISEVSLLRGQGCLRLVAITTTSFIPRNPYFRPLEAMIVSISISLISMIGVYTFTRAT